MGSPSRKSLSVVAAHADQRERVGGFLDADADRDAAEAVRQVDHGFAQPCVDLVAAAVSDKDTIEFQLRERQRLGPRQRGIAAAEIIDREIDVEGPQFVRNLVGHRKFRNDLFFRHVDNHTRPLVEPRAKGLDDVGDGDPGQYLGGDVDGEPHVEAEPGEAEIGFEASRQGLLGQRDQACFGSTGHERARRQHA